MPMPDLDPSRFKPAWRSDTTHRLPLGGREFIDGERIDTHDPFFMHLLADRSLTLDAPVAPEAPAEAEPAANEPPEPAEAH